MKAFGPKWDPHDCPAYAVHGRQCPYWGTAVRDCCHTPDLIDWPHAAHCGMRRWRPNRLTRRQRLVAAIRRWWWLHR